MEFEFDHAKSASNKQKHGVSFEDAQQIWQGAYIVATIITTGEARWMAVGSIHGKVHACIYTIRRDALRLISCRRARDKEARLYYEHIEAKNGEN